MTAEELRLVIDRQNQEVLEMKTHELFLKRCAEQLEAFREAFEFCDVELASQCFPNCEGVGSETMRLVKGGHFDQAAFNRKQQAKQFLKVLQDQIDSILKEARGLADEDGINFQTFTISQLPRSDGGLLQSYHLRKLMNERLVNLI